VRCWWRESQGEMPLDDLFGLVLEVLVKGERGGRYLFV